MNIEGLDHIALGVNNLSESIKWYRDVLGLKVSFIEEWGDRPVMVLGSNGTGLALFASPGNIKDNALNLPHIAFKVSVESLVQMQETLKNKQIYFEKEDHIISRSIYLRDPDQYYIEITAYLRSK